ncbi:MAG: peroxidase-related enzyme [Alphaproteobacteria bacterium]|nr:peroxidase-related enzyme [Alphaproteobacteria bacterium]
MPKAWIKMITDNEASEEVKSVFDQARTPHGTLDNVMRIHGLRPDTMLGHLHLYRSVLHSNDLTLAISFLEVIASYVSSLNQCDYSFTHHWHNAEKLIDNIQLSNSVYGAIKKDNFEGLFEVKELALLKYAKKLTLSIQNMEKNDVEKLRVIGIIDGEILEVNQVVAYFNYSNRLLNGLGVSTSGDVVGFYSGSDEC